MENPSLEILTYFNQITGKKVRPINSNLKGISARLADGYTPQQLKEVIQMKTLEWQNNEVMAVHLHPITLFRPANFDKYVNQVETIRKNPEKYVKHFAKINNRSISASDDHDGLADLYGSQ